MLGRSAWQGEQGKKMGLSKDGGRERETNIYKFFQPYFWEQLQ